MGKIEQGLKKEMRRTKINNAIIGTIAVAGVLAVGAIAPNALGMLGKMKFLKQRRYQLKSAFSRMIDNGYVAIEKKGETSYARLTKKGEHFAALINDGRIVPKKQKRWDGKWRVLIFDIDETHKRIRNKIRTSLITLGFVRLQDSVWVYPYDCEDLIVILKMDLKIGREVLYMIADRIENDGALRRRFGLPA